MNQTSHQAGIPLLKRALRFAADVGGDIAKLGAVLAVPFGSLLLTFYLTTVSAPFPANASSLPTLLVVLAILCTFVIIVFALTMMWSVLQAMPFMSPRLRHELPNLRTQATRPHRRRNAPIEYALANLPFLLLWACAFVSAITGWEPSSGLFWLFALLAAYIGGTVVSAGLFYLFKSTSRPTFFYSGDRLHRSITFAVLTSVDSLLTLWLLVIYIVAIEELVRWEDQHGIVLLTLILVTHAFANLSPLERGKTVMGCAAIHFFVLSWAGGFPMYGAASLRVLGIGGGLPREIALRTIDAGSGTSVIKVITGCLLLRAGGEVAIHPESDPKSCTLSYVLHHDDTSQKPPWRVDTYSDVDILRLSTLPRTTLQNDGHS